MRGIACDCLLGLEYLRTVCLKRRIVETLSATHGVDFLEGEPYDYGKRHVAKAVCELGDLERRYFMHVDERALCRLCGQRTDSGRNSTANWIGSDRKRRLERPRYREPCEIAVLQAAQCACARCHDR